LIGAGLPVAGRCRYGPVMADVSLSFPAFALGGQQFRALPCGAVCWEAEGLLLVADLHLEKGSAFARRGWLLPPHDSLETLSRLAGAIRQSGARRVAVLGDSFHDGDGPGRLLPEARALLAGLLQATDWLWVTGNHDGAHAGALGGRVEAEVEIRGVVLRHEAVPGFAGPEISGHFHPKVSVALRTGRRVSRRCLAVGGDRMVLPAYGAYAGGLSVDDVAFVEALGERPEALVPIAGGLIRIPPSERDVAA
jgi:DNA ligase-associated metallophosphoesterase